VSCIDCPLCVVMLRYLVVAACVAVVTQASPAKKDANCTQDGLERCGADLIIFASGPKIPTTPAELKENCPKEQQSEKCARDYSNNCLPRLPKGMVTLFLDGVRTEVTGKCKEGSTKNKEYLKHAKCLNDQGEKLHGCMQQLVNVLDQTVSKAQGSSKDAQKKQLRESCCSFTAYRTCMGDAAKGPCGADSAKYVDNVINGYAGDLLDTVCAAYSSESDQCKAVAPIKPKAGAPKNLLSPLAKMVTSLQAQG